jgi:DNA-binding FadR family transcriptional regulator
MKESSGRRILETAKSQREHGATVSAHIAALIRERIVGQELQPGDRIPAERELAQQFGVARSGVREALQELRTQGFVVSYRGQKGTYVAGLDDLVSAQSFGDLLVEHSGRLADLYEFSLSTAVEAAGLAALRRLPEDLEALDAVVEAMRAQADRLDPALDVAFHEALSKAAHNAFFSQVIKASMRILSENMPFVLTTVGEGPSASKHLLAQHSAIADAVRMRDAQKAREATVEHLQWVFREIYRIEKKLKHPEEA